MNVNEAIARVNREAKDAGVSAGQDELKAALESLLVRYGRPEFNEIDVHIHDHDDLVTITAIVDGPSPSVAVATKGQ